MTDNHRPRDFPLNDALQEVLQQGATRARELRDAQQQLHSLQACLAEADRSCVCVCSAVCVKERLLSAAHCEMEQVCGATARLDAEIRDVLLENLRLRSAIEEQQEKNRTHLAEYSLYRGRVEEHRRTLMEQENRKTDLRERENRPDVHQELQRRELDDSNKEIDLLKASIHECRQTARKRRAELEEEERAQMQLRAEIQIQQRRCEAVLKRLRCQLMKAQAGHRQLTQLEHTLQELRAQLEELR